MGAPFNTLKAFYLDDDRQPSKFSYLAGMQPSEHDNWIVEQKFNQTLRALESAGISTSEQQQHLQVT